MAAVPEIPDFAQQFVDGALSKDEYMAKQVPYERELASELANLEVNLHMRVGTVKSGDDEADASLKYIFLFAERIPIHKSNGDKIQQAIWDFKKRFPLKFNSMRLTASVAFIADILAPPPEEPEEEKGHSHDHSHDHGNAGGSHTCPHCGGAKPAPKDDGKTAV